MFKIFMFINGYNDVILARQMQLHAELVVAIRNSILCNLFLPVMHYCTELEED
jgi:hypothetical protein